MYAFLLIVLLLLLYWYSRREPPPVYVAPIVPDLTNIINTGPTDMALILPVAAVDNSVSTSSSVDNSLVPVTPPIGPSVNVPDMTSTDVMNTSTPSAPIVTGGAVDPAASPTINELAGEYVENPAVPEPVPTNICICQKWANNKNKCLRKYDASGYITHKTNGGAMCPDPVCQTRDVMGIHNYVRFFPGLIVPLPVMTSSNNIFGMCRCARYKGLCVKNNHRCLLSSDKQCLWPQCKTQVSQTQVKLEDTSTMKHSIYKNLLAVYKQKIIVRDSRQKLVDSYLPMLNSTREKVKNAELKFNSAKVAESQALTNLNNAIASKAPNLIITNFTTIHMTLLNSVNTSLQAYNSEKTILASREVMFVKRQKDAVTAKEDASLTDEKTKKAEIDAFNAYIAAYGQVNAEKAHMAIYGRPPPTSTGLLASAVDQSISAATTVASTVASAFGNLSSFLNYRSGYNLRGY